MTRRGCVYRVVRPMNDQHAMMFERVDDADVTGVRAGAGADTVHAVDYANPEDRERLAVLSTGETVRLEATRVGLRANVWRVDQLFPGTGGDAVRQRRARPPDAV